MKISFFGEADTARCGFAPRGVVAMDKCRYHCECKEYLWVDHIEIIRLNYYWHALCFYGNVAVNPLIIMRDGVDT